MLKIEVGANFPLTVVQDGSMIDLQDEGFFVFIGMDKITNEEILDFRRGKLNLDLSIIDDIMIFVLEIGSVILSDIPFHTSLARPSSDIRDAIQTNSDNFYPLHIFLVDTEDNTLKAMRLVGLSPEFSKVIEKLMIKEIGVTFNLDKYNNKLDKIFETMTQMDIRDMSIAHFASKYNSN